MSLISTNNRYLHDEIVILAKRLVKTMPEPLSVCFFVNSGSEANDLALRLARIHTKKKDVVTLDHAYHGHLTSMIDISPYKFNLPGGPDKPDWVHVASVPDVYRGKYTYPNDSHSEEELGRLYADEVEKFCLEAKSRNGGVCAFIAESLQSCGGQIIPPDGYLQRVYQHIRDADGVCIADEVQVGFGRVGTHMWAFETQDVIPDIVTVGKPMGNGHPVAAEERLMERALRVGNHLLARCDALKHAHRLCAGAACSSASSWSLTGTLGPRPRLRRNTSSIGNTINHLLARCDALKHAHRLVGDVRGRGLFVGVELVTDRDTRTPAMAEAKHVVNSTRTGWWETCAGAGCSSASSWSLTGTQGPRPRLRRNTSSIGNTINHLLARCDALKHARRLLGDVRGCGLFVSVELVTNRDTRTAATAEAKHVVNRMREENILISRDGPDSNVLKFKPPMVFSTQDADRLVETLDRVLAELDGRMPPTKLQLEVMVTQLDNDVSSSQAIKANIQQAVKSS
ncbi:Alanine-glyoxylate aminotransferase [Operophtera brumata]|uniref:Alanine-glyoxylate aminotransferase n=1 Tax=Operophtera brumata TaxID=104452 RepID=A0A0L7LKU0_OPEBR|nr:Alanine-glyoxylate aminotransferase [Operophtera brumata]